MVYLYSGRECMPLFAYLFIYYNRAYIWGLGVVAVTLEFGSESGGSIPSVPTKRLTNTKEIKIMNVNEIPKDLLDRIRISFDTNKDVMLLRTAQQEAQRVGNFQKALHIAQQIDNLWTICLDNYMRKMEAQGKQISLKASDLPEKDKDELFNRVMVLFMCCDIIESATIDMNDILRRTEKDASITTFEDLRQILSLAKEKLKYLQDTGDYMKDLVWADNCDNMYEMMISKASSIIRKRRESKNWGKNTEKFYK